VDERLAELSAKGDPLEALNRLVKFELFRPELDRAVPRADRSKGGRPAFDSVLMFKILILQASHNMSDERCEYLIKDRLSFIRFLGLGAAGRSARRQHDLVLPRGATKAGAIDLLFQRFDAVLREAGFLAMGGPIIDATSWRLHGSGTPRLKNRTSSKAVFRPYGVGIRPNCGRRTTMRTGRAKYKAKPCDGVARLVDFAIPAFG
jgi:transposase